MPSREDLDKVLHDALHDPAALRHVQRSIHGKPGGGIRAFRDKYGLMGAGLLIEEFVARSPSFPGGEELARALGRMSAELESALSDLPE